MLKASGLPSESPATNPGSSPYGFANIMATQNRPLVQRTEGHPRLDTRAEQGDGSFALPNQPHAVVDSPWPEPRLRYLKTPSLSLLGGAKPHHTHHAAARTVGLLRLKYNPASTSL